MRRASAGWASLLQCRSARENQGPFPRRPTFPFARGAEEEPSVCLFVFVYLFASGLAEEA